MPTFSKGISRRRLGISGAVAVAGVAALSLVGAVILAAAQVHTTTSCFRFQIVPQTPCPEREHSLVGVAVVGEIAALFAILVVILAAQYAAFQAEVYLARAERRPS